MQNRGNALILLTDAPKSAGSYTPPGRRPTFLANQMELLRSCVKPLQNARCYIVLRLNLRNFLKWNLLLVLMKKLLWLMTLATIFSSMSIQFLVPFYAIFVENIGGGLILAGATWAIYKVVSGLTILFTSTLSDKYDPYNFIVLGFGLRVIGTAGYFLVSGPIHLLTVQIIQGVAHAFIVPSYRKIYSTNLDKGHEAVEWSYPSAGSEVAQGIAVLVGGIIVASIGFTWLFGVMLLAHVISLIFAILIKKRSKTRGWSNMGSN